LFLPIFSKRVPRLRHIVEQGSTFGRGVPGHFSAFASVLLVLRDLIHAWNVTHSAASIELKIPLKTGPKALIDLLPPRPRS